VVVVFGAVVRLGGRPSTTLVLSSRGRCRIRCRLADPLLVNRRFVPITNDQHHDRHAERHAGTEDVAKQTVR
jgi:hypothetical protein